MLCCWFGVFIDPFLCPFDQLKEGSPVSHQDYDGDSVKRGKSGFGRWFSTAVTHVPQFSIMSEMVGRLKNEGEESSHNQNAGQVGKGSEDSVIRDAVENPKPGPMQNNDRIIKDLSGSGFKDKVLSVAERKRRDCAMKKNKVKISDLSSSELSGRYLFDSDLKNRWVAASKEVEKTLALGRKLGIQVIGAERALPLLVRNYKVEMVLLQETKKDSLGSMEFNEFILNCNIVDLHMRGKKFTWFGLGNKRSRLDRLLIDERWLLEDTNVVQLGLKRSVSDHVPMLVTNGELDWSPRPFQFINDWLNLMKLLKLLENFHKTGKLPRSLNTSFISLIPKVDNPSEMGVSFDGIGKDGVRSHLEILDLGLHFLGQSFNSSQRIPQKSSVWERPLIGGTTLPVLIYHSAEALHQLFIQAESPGAIDGIRDITPNQIFFSSLASKVEELASGCGCKVGYLLFTYLGIPLGADSQRLLARDSHEGVSFVQGMGLESIDCHCCWCESCVEELITLFFGKSQCQIEMCIAGVIAAATWNVWLNRNEIVFKGEEALKDNLLVNEEIWWENPRICLSCVHPSMPCSLLFAPSLVFEIAGVASRGVGDFGGVCRSASGEIKPILSGSVLDASFDIAVLFGTKSACDIFVEAVWLGKSNLVVDFHSFLVQN
ncbi:hypothetical protein F3Y22_tig00111207pilonHSYRG00185 [Hibiscus syriacus]|uniref:Uncharacterized protein n=1 Tax=Hibiscus syriacus TaxID=106335 RepID=A0A6A2YVS4_HIBSY|nr:hypothetical protein F3Y22_tig00111207pilonHSYRG00185 [Hibiscus syriacus]